jgi:hypothetical protein
MKMNEVEGNEEEMKADSYPGGREWNQYDWNQRWRVKLKKKIWAAKSEPNIQLEFQEDELCGLNQWLIEKLYNVEASRTTEKLLV